MLETVHGAVRRLSKISNCTFECDYYYYYYYSKAGGLLALQSDSSHSARGHMPGKVSLPGELEATLAAGKLDDASVDEVVVLPHGALHAEALVADGALEGVDTRVLHHVTLQVLLLWELLSTLLHTDQWFRFTDLLHGVDLLSQDRSHCQPLQHKGTEC